MTSAKEFPLGLSLDGDGEPGVAVRLDGREEARPPTSEICGRITSVTNGKVNSRDGP